MGTLTTAAKNIAADAVGAVTTYLAAFFVTAITGVTGTASSDTLTKSSHGLTNGDMVMLTELTGGSGITAGTANNADGNARVYWVMGVSGSDFQLCATDALATAVNFTTDISAVTVNKLAEVTGGSPAYARKAASYSGSASGGADSLASTVTFDVPAGIVGAVAGYSAATSGTMYEVDGIAFLTFSAQGTLAIPTAPITVTD